MGGFMPKGRPPSLEDETLAALRHGLTDMQREFVDQWLVCREGVKSARAAGYSGTPAVLAVTASDNLRHPKIKQVIRLMMDVSGASAGEAIDTLTRQQRARMGDFLDDRGDVDPDKVRAAGPGIVESWNPALGLLRLYSAQKAAEIVLRAFRQDDKDASTLQLGGNVTFRFEPSEEHKKLRAADDKAKTDKPVD